MHLRDWIRRMEAIAPPELAMDWDNVGLLVGPEKSEIKRVLVALDCTPEVAREAAAMGAELVLTHHPLFFEPVRRLLPEAPETAAACILLRSGVGLYAAHTNLDAAPGGVNDVLSALFGAREVQPFGDGVGRIGTLETPVTLSELTEAAERLLKTRVRVEGDLSRVVRRAAFLGGAGGGDIKEAAEAGADVFVTGEIKHNQAIDAHVLGLACIAAGHYETERIVLQPLMERLQTGANDVQYSLAQADAGPFCAV